MLSDEERDIVEAGRLAKKLIEYPEWKMFTGAIEKLRENFTTQALQRGDKEYEKGAVFAINLVLSAPTDTITAREELLARERRLHPEEDEFGEEVSSEFSSEKAP